MQNTSPQVLIVGAGPTGLNLALSLARRKVPFRLIDQAAGPGEQSRAVVVHARTLEFYRQYGFAGEVLAEGIPIAHAAIREVRGQDRRSAMTLNFEDMGHHQSPFSTPLGYPQDYHEKLLLRQLEAAGGKVEWNTRLLSFAQREDRVEAELQFAGDRTAKESFAYICGCDGSHSAVRRQLDIGFPGGTYSQLYYVADVRIEGTMESELDVCLGRHTFSLRLPIRRSGDQRLIGLVPEGIPERPGITFEDIRADVEPLAGVHVTHVNWFSTYRVHHRVANHFREGRAFLLGDAGHLHSPAGGQGMNTGIGDAVNLGWKLSQVLQGRAHTSLLDSYEPERIQFAHTLVRTTDEAFKMMNSGGLLGELGRRIAIPGLIYATSRLDAPKHAFFRAVSQLQIEYESSPISDGRAGHIKGGDRLPWVDDGADNFAPLASLDWQAHVYGSATEELLALCEQSALPLHQFAWNENCEQASLERDALYLVRPDGYIGLASMPRGACDELKKYLAQHGISMRQSAVA